jgi:hypothetical protein
VLNISNERADLPVMMHSWRLAPWFGAQAARPDDRNNPDRQGRVRWLGRFYEKIARQASHLGDGPVRVGDKKSPVAGRGGGFPRKKIFFLLQCIHV